MTIDSRTPYNEYGACFEDDGDTGYFYALDYRDKENPIQDALSIYDVKAVKDGHIPSEVKIVWARDGTKTALLINGYPHAVFDFVTKRGFCRSDFPPPSSKWPQSSHEWDDVALGLFD